MLMEKGTAVWAEFFSSSFFFNETLLGFRSWVLVDVSWRHTRFASLHNFNCSCWAGLHDGWISNLAHTIETELIASSFSDQRNACEFVRLLGRPSRHTVWGRLLLLYHT